MPSAGDAVALAAVGIGMVLVGSVVAGVQLPGGTPTTRPDQQRYTLNVAVSVGATTTAGLDPTGGLPRIKADTFRSCVTPSGLFSLSVTGGRMLSLTKAENVEVRYTVTGPSGTVTAREQLGDISKLGGGKTSSARFTKLAPGEYTVRVEAFSDSGRDSFETSVTVDGSTAVGSCGGGL